MGSIAAGTDFGQAVAQPRRLSESQVPRAAFGVTDNLQRAGAQLEAEGRFEQRQVDAEREQLQREQQAVRQRADAAVAQSRLYLQRDKLNDTLAEIDQGIQTGTIPKTDAARVWQERSAAVLKAAGDGVPESHAQAVQLDGETLTQSMASKIGGFVQRRDRADTLAALNSTLEHTQRLAVTDPDKARQVTADTLAQLAPAAGLTPEQVQKIQQGWTEQTSYTRAFSAVNAAKNDNKALGVVEAALADNTEIDPQRKAGLLAQIENFRGANEARALRAAQHAEVVAARRQRESSQAFGVLSAWALAGKAANPEANAGLIAKLTPEDAAAYRAMAAEVPARTAAAMLPLDAQAQQLSQLYEMRNARGTDQRLEAEIKRREQVLTQSRTDYGNEPLQAAQERGILDVPLQPLNVGNIDALVQGVATRAQQAQAVATRTGRPVSPLLNEEADKLGRMVMALPASQRADRIAQLSQVIPPDQGQALAAQLIKGESEEKRALGIAFALGNSRTTAGRATSELALRGAEALKGKTIKEEKTPVDGWQGRIAKQLDGIYVTPQQSEMVGQAARLILAGLVAEGASGSDADANKAVRLAAGGDLREHNGARILIPAGLELGDVRKRVSSMTPTDLAPQLPDGTVYVARRPIPVAEFLAKLPDAQLQYAGAGKYLVKTGGTYAANLHHQPLLIEVSK